MNMAVLTHEFAPENPDNVPAAWPYEVVELGDSQELPGPDWVLMTHEEYANYKLERQEEFNVWKAEQDAVKAEAKAIEDQKAFVRLGVANFIEQLVHEVVAENKALRIDDSGQAGNFAGLMAMKLVLPPNLYPVSIRDALAVMSLKETLRVIDYFLANILTYEIPQFFTTERLQYYRKKIDLYIQNT